MPVEFDSSRRALAVLRQDGLVTLQEEEGIHRVLNAAALTYMAAALMAVTNLLAWSCSPAVETEESQVVPSRGGNLMGSRRIGRVGLGE